MQDLITWETQSSTPIQVDNMTITPQTKLLRVQVPHFGFVWNRPSGVLIEENGRIEYHPIVDVTRTAVFAIAGITILFNLLFFFGRALRFGGNK